MRLEFFLVVMVVSIFRYNKLFCNPMKVYNDRFDGGCCGGPGLLTDQKIVANGPKRVFGFVTARHKTWSVWFIVLINYWLCHNTVDPKIISREVRYCIIHRMHTVISYSLFHFL